LKRRLKASGYRLQGCGNVAGVALAATKSEDKAPLANPLVYR
jgi:hypothetical protein